MAVRSSLKLGLLGLLGALICAGGGIMFALFPLIIESKMKEMLKLVNGTEVFQKWVEFPVPIYFQIYVFNVTNSEDVQNFGARPIIQQLGPYTYREYRKKRNITWSDGNRLMSFYQDKYYIFLVNMSSGTQEDKITTLNFPVIGVIHKLKEQPLFVRIIMNNFLYKDGIFVTKTVDELFFKGYKVDIVDKIQRLTGLNIIPNGIFGFFHNRNNTDDGLYVVNTGEGDLTKFGMISAWNGSSSVPYWNGKYCNMINGSDGTIYPPFLTKDTIVRGFATELCRSGYATFEDERIIEGIKGYRFTAPFLLFKQHTENPDNECFCLGGPSCEHSGLFNVGVCNFDAPAVASGPHFYMSEPDLQETVIGLNPNKFEHQAILDIEPMTGMPLNAAKKLQFNAVLEPVPGLKITEKLPRMLFPVFWGNESAKVTPEFAAEFKSKITTPLFIATVLMYTLIGVGAFIMLSVVIYRLKFYKGKNSQRNLM